MKGLLKALEAQRMELKAKVRANKDLDIEWVEAMVFSENDLVDQYLTDNDLEMEDFDDTSRDFQHDTCRECEEIMEER